MRNDFFQLLNHLTRICDFITLCTFIARGISDNHKPVTQISYTCKRSINIVLILIHSLRMEGDIMLSPRAAHMRYFNPLPPYGGRHAADERLQSCCCISIHSLRMEGDQIKTFSNASWSDFNPLPPYGGRRCEVLWLLLDFLFQSTPSVWRETAILHGILDIVTNFNPLPPYGGRLSSAVAILKDIGISIHSLRMEGDHFSDNAEHADNISIHSLRMEGDSIVSIYFKCFFLTPNTFF